MVSESDIFAARILIVDDQAPNVQMLQQMLFEAGYQNVSTTQNPLEVCTLHSQNHFDLIVLDIQMPAMDGFKVMARLNELEVHSYAPVLAITAYPDHKLKALASGALDFIAKPFDLEEVKTRIHNLLEVRLLYRHLEETNHTLESMALHDVLTGLPNRRLLMDRLGQAMVASTRSKSHGALMFLDLDNFKRINDTLGHDSGDILLQQIANRLQACVRDGDSVARLGGDEFVILLTSLGLNKSSATAQAEHISAKILASLSQDYHLGPHLYQSAASIGIAIFVGEKVSQDELLREADTAMYLAKASGGNRSSFLNT